MLKISLDKLPEITNDYFYQLYDDESFLLLLYGGAGSGKSVFAAQKLVYRIITEGNHRFVVLRKIADTLRESVYDLIIETLDTFGLSGYYQTTVSPMKITIPCFNSEFIFKGLDKNEKIKSINKPTGLWLEEVTEFTENDFNQLCLRIRGQMPGIDYKQVILSFNPIYPSHWLKKRFFDSKEDNCTVSHSTYLNNQFLDDDDIKKIEKYKEIDDYYYQVYALGKWGILKGKIFTNYRVEDFTDIEKTFDNLRYGLDWGFASDPLAVSKIHLDLKRRKLYFIDELYLFGHTNDKAFPLIKKMIGENRITADSSEPKSIQEAKNYGLNIKGAVKGPGSVEHGIKFLQSFEIIIHPRCVNTKKEFDKYKYKQDKNGNIIPEPVDEDNHIIDESRYALENDSTGSSHGLMFGMI